MSMNLMVEAMKSKVGNSGRKLVLVKLADNANDNGDCWPSYQHIADNCEMGRSTVKSHIKELEKNGFLRIIERNGGKSSNKYHLTISNGKCLDTRSESNPVKKQPGQDSTLTRSDFSPPPVKIQPTPGQDLTPEPVIEPVIESIIETNNAPTALALVPNNENSVNPKPKKKSAEQEFKSALSNKGVSDHLATEWVAVRKSKRLPLSIGAIDIIEAEAEKAEHTISEALTTCVLRGWGGFKSQWLINDRNSSNLNTGNRKQNTSLDWDDKTWADDVNEGLI